MGVLDPHVTEEEFEEWQRSHFEPLKRRADKLLKKSEAESYVADHGKQHEGINGTLSDQAAKLRRGLEEIRATKEGITSGVKKLESHLNGNLGERLAPLFRDQLSQIDGKFTQQTKATAEGSARLLTEMRAEQQACLKQMEANLNDQRTQSKSGQEEFARLLAAMRSEGQEHLKQMEANLDQQRKQIEAAEEESGRLLKKMSEERQRGAELIAQAVEAVQTNMEKCQRLQQAVAEVSEACQKDAAVAGASAREIAARLAGCETFLGRVRWLLRGGPKTDEITNEQG